MIKLEKITIKSVLRKALLQYDIEHSDLFTKKLNDYLQKVNIAIDNKESEEHCKNLLKTFLERSFVNTYSGNINTHERIDLAIYQDARPAVLIEAKRLSNTNEMISLDDINKKALHELLLYYFRQRKSGNLFIKHMIITDMLNFYIIDANEFEKLFNKYKDLSRLFNDYVNGKLAITDNESFYKAVSSLLDKSELSLEMVYFNLQELKDKDYLNLYKLLSPYHLLKESLTNDKNALNKPFYHELLFILGLKENKNNQLELSSDSDISLMQMTINSIKNAINRSKISHDKLAYYDGTDEQQRIFSMALHLNIVWLNRILFLKLLESELVSFSAGKISKFLTIDKITNFNDLKSLFFNILAIPKSRRIDDYFTHSFDDLPYLNSSLFQETLLEETISISDLRDKDGNIEIYYKSILSKIDKIQNAPSSMLEYIWRFLNAYNFGKTENFTYSDQLIDHSVLGSVFEKLNGYKDGSHYTPSHITMFMARESIQTRILDKINSQLSLSLENFDELGYSLFTKKIDKADVRQIVDTITIIDPAVGSGHFLVSSLNEFVCIKSELGLLTDESGTPLKVKISIENDDLVIKDIFDEIFTYRINNNGVITDEAQSIQKAIFQAKKHIIEKQLHGVDINPKSVHICRLRLWIELLKSTYYIDNSYTDLEVLPNLEFKIIAANSLKSLNDSDLFIKKVITEFNQISQDYFNNTSKKQEYLAKLDKIEYLDEHMAQVMKTFKPFDEHNVCEFFDPYLFFGIERFDIVISNPPYIQLQSNGGALAQLYKSEKYETLTRTGDIYTLFYELGAKFLQPNGILAYITSNKWMRAGYGEKLREFFATKTTPIKLIDLGSGVFESATVDSNILLYKNTKAETHSLKAIALNEKSKPLSEIGEEDYYVQTDLSKESWTILSPIEKKIKEKIEAIGTPLKDWDININYGIKTGYNEAFIIDGAKKDELIATDPKSAEIIKPILRGRDIKRYKAEFADKWLIFIPWHFPLHKDESIQGASEKAEKAFQEQYPAIYNHLLEHKERLSKRNKAETGIRYEWYALQRCAASYHQDFEKEKVVWQELSQGSCFDFDEKGIFFISNTGYIMTGKYIRYVFALLNSKFIETSFRKYYSISLGNTGLRWLNQYIEKLPIPRLSEEEQQPFVALVDKILHAKESDPHADTTAWEREIDQMVYTLYGLTDEEIKVVEDA